MRIAKLKSAYNSLIIGPRGFGALSLRWIQFESVLRCARSSSTCLNFDTAPTVTNSFQLIITYLKFSILNYYYKSVLVV